MTDGKTGENLFRVILGKKNQEVLKASVHINSRPLRGKHEVDFGTNKKQCV